MDCRHCCPAWKLSLSPYYSVWGSTRLRAVCSHVGHVVKSRGAAERVEVELTSRFASRVTAPLKVILFQRSSLTMKKCRSLQPKTSGTKRTAETLSCNLVVVGRIPSRFPPFHSCFREASILLLPTVLCAAANTVKCM
jgi:hypothetical protein